MLVTKYSEFSKLNKILRRYGHLPSMGLVRTPEVMYLERVLKSEPSLDHCCGDGFLAQLVFDEGFSAGADFSEEALQRAAKRKRPDSHPYYAELQECDVADRLPWPDDTFDFVVNNSGLEHVEGLDRALTEIARVLRPGGRFVFTLASKRYFDWWRRDLPEGSMEQYINHQPYHNILSFDDWKERLIAVGLHVVDFESHFNRQETEKAQWYDYYHSMRHFAGTRLPWSLRLPQWVPPLARIAYGRLVRRSSFHSYPKEDRGSCLCITSELR